MLLRFLFFSNIDIINLILKYSVGILLKETFASVNLIKCLYIYIFFLLFLVHMICQSGISSPAFTGSSTLVCRMETCLNRFPPLMLHLCIFVTWTSLQKCVKMKSVAFIFPNILLVCIQLLFSKQNGSLVLLKPQIKCNHANLSVSIHDNVSVCISIATMSVQDWAINPGFPKPRVCCHQFLL